MNRRIILFKSSIFLFLLTTFPTNSINLHFFYFFYSMSFHRYWHFLFLKSIIDGFINFFLLRRCWVLLQSKFQSISPGTVWTDAIKNLVGGDSRDLSLLQPEDIADAVMYVLSTPERVNVSIYKLFHQFFVFSKTNMLRIEVNIPKL